MKKISVVLIAALVVSLLFGCGKSDDAKGTGKTTLSVWYWGEQEVPGYKAYMEEMVKRYEKKNPDIKVEAVLQESDNLYTAFRTAEAAGEGPDIQYMWGGTQAMEDVWKGNVAPISDYISEEELSVITTWDEFLECCEKLKSSGITPLGMGLKDGYLPAWIGIFLGQQNMDSVNDMISLMSGQESFTDKKYSEWLEKIAELKEAGYINEDILSLDLYQGQQLIESKKAAMTLHTQPYAVSLEKSLGSDQIGFAKAPVFGTGKFADSVATPSQVYVIPNSAKHKEEAADFLLFLQEEDNIKYLYESANAMMPNNNFDESWVSSEIDRKVLEWQKEDNNFCYQLYFAPMFETDGLIPTVQKMFSEGLAPKDAAVELDEALGKCMEQNPEVHDAFLEWSVEE